MTPDLGAGVQRVQGHGPFRAVCSTSETTPLLGEVQQQVIAPCLRSEPFTLFCPRARILGAAPRANAVVSRTGH